jgi:hemolysin III
MRGVWRRGKLAADEVVKPLLRGKIHFVGFYLFLVQGLYLIYVSPKEIYRLCISIYLLSMILLFGTSTVYHTSTWIDHDMEMLVQKMDHASIFLLIVGTYTPTCVLLFDVAEVWPLRTLAAAWCIGIAGVLKSILVTNPPKVFNVLFYFLCGLTIVPFLPNVIFAIGWKKTLFMALGGILYLLGGTIYGLEWPDPAPKYYGFHEIFHTLTLVANICFLLPIIHNTLMLR